MYKIFVVLILLSSCVNQSFRDKFLTVKRPDEFNIQTNKKLVIPKKFDLPKPTDKLKENNSVTRHSLSEAEKNIMSKTAQFDNKTLNRKQRYSDTKSNRLARIF